MKLFLILGILVVLKFVFIITKNNTIYLLIGNDAENCKINFSPK